MGSKFLFAFYIILHAEILQGKMVNQKPLRLKPLTKCTYDYEVTVYTARGDKSTHSDGYQVHALVSIDSFLLIAMDLPIKYLLHSSHVRPVLQSVQIFCTPNVDYMSHLCLVYLLWGVQIQ